MMGRVCRVQRSMIVEPHARWRSSAEAEADAGAGRPSGGLAQSRIETPQKSVTLWRLLGGQASTRWQTQFGIATSECADRPKFARPTLPKQRLERSPDRNIRQSFSDQPLINKQQR